MAITAPPWPHRGSHAGRWCTWRRFRRAARAARAARAEASSRRGLCRWCLRNCQVGEEDSHVSWVHDTYKTTLL